jgi:DNA-binding GntR family transcriptional regulator
VPTGVAEATIRERIAAAIAEGEFPPGTQLVESMLAERFGVSRSPVRGALRALEGDGLVVHYPHRGDFVAALSPADIEEIFYLREVLEVAAVRLAYERIQADELRRVEQLLDSLSPEEDSREDFLASDDTLHDLIARNSGNGRLRYALKQLSAQIQFTRRTSMSRRSRLAANLAEHKEIVAALRLGDLPLIEARLRVHLKAGKESTLEACRAMLFSQGDPWPGVKAARGRIRDARGPDSAAPSQEGREAAV